MSLIDTPLFARVLVANRGEIALRVLRTCRRLGIPTVAIHTAADRDAPHVRAADEAVEVASYLDIEEVAEAAHFRGKGDCGVHPGYGFLSERSAFARELEGTDGVVLVGPSAAVMDAMGRKDAAREIAVAAGVPVVPSYAVDADGRLVEEVGQQPSRDPYPVLVKAAAGGGGKGMRVVRSADEFAEACAAAAREAAHSFGDDTLLVEKYVERGRHIEVQVFGDSAGNVVHFFERDCSTQRRHQKVLEEAPAPALSAEQRAGITTAAVDLAREVGYTNAGTVEFLLDVATGEFYFLEMNTRLQVEHPVTEEVVRVRGERVDLVELQLRIAAGEPLDFTQDDVTVEGHAIEARVYAEDAFGGFLPQAGTATAVQWPSGEGVRVDHALEAGQVVSTSYDPMLGKVIVHAADREQARRALVAALDDTAILGLTTNTGFLRELVACAEFAAPGGIDTAWLDRHDVPVPDPVPARAIAARLWMDQNTAPTGPFASDGFRMGAAAAATTVEFDEPTTPAARVPDGTVARTTKHGVELAHHGQRYLFTRPDASADHGAAAGDGTIAAPMPGTVLDVRVAEGDHVSEGQVLGVVEAMKMELALKAPYAGTVTRVAATVAQQVALGAVLFVVEGVAEVEEAARGRHETPSRDESTS